MSSFTSCYVFPFEHHTPLVSAIRATGEVAALMSPIVSITCASTLSAAMRESAVTCNLAHATRVHGRVAPASLLFFAIQLNVFHHRCELLLLLLVLLPLLLVLLLLLNASSLPPTPMRARLSHGSPIAPLAEVDVHRAICSAAVGLYWLLLTLSARNCISVRDSTAGDEGSLPLRLEKSTSDGLESCSFGGIAVHWYPPTSRVHESRS